MRAFSSILFDSGIRPPPDFINAHVLAATTNEVETIPKRVIDFTITNQGTSYTNSGFPIVTLTNPGGAGVQATALVLMEVEGISNFGAAVGVSGWKVGDYGTIKTASSDLVLRPARFRVLGLAGDLAPASVVFTDRGLYAGPPTPVGTVIGASLLIPTQEWSGVGTSAEVQVNFRVQSIRVLNPGSGYQATPSVTPSGGAGSSVAATALMVVEPRYIVLDATADTYCKFGTSSGVTAAVPADTTDGSASFYLRADKPLMIDLSALPSNITHIAFFSAGTPTVTLSYYN